MPIIEHYNDVAATADTILISLTIGIIFGILGTIAFYSFIYSQDKSKS
jgi:hypothetical protein